MITVKTPERNFKIWWRYSEEVHTSFKRECRGRRTIIVTEQRLVSTICCRTSDGIYLEREANCSPEDFFTKAEGRVRSLNKLLDTKRFFSNFEQYLIVDAFKNSNIKDKCLDCLVEVKAPKSKTETIIEKAS